MILSHKKAQRTQRFFKEDFLRLLRFFAAESDVAS
jgi:hypothetical protein